MALPCTTALPCAAPGLEIIHSAAADSQRVRNARPVFAGVGGWVSGRVGLLGAAGRRPAISKPKARRRAGGAAGLNAGGARGSSPPPRRGVRGPVNVPGRACVRGGGAVSARCRLSATKSHLPRGSSNFQPRYQELRGSEQRLGLVPWRRHRAAREKGGLLRRCHHHAVVSPHALHHVPRKLISVRPTAMWCAV